MGLCQVAKFAETTMDGCIMGNPLGWVTISRRLAGLETNTIRKR